MAVTRRTEPWSALLEAGRSDDRLVREAYEGARAAGLRRACPPTCTRRCAQGAGQRAGIDALYTHQAQALRERVGGDDDRHHGDGVAASRCASTCRRSRCCCTDAKARALYLYPTKALAQDQARALQRLRAGQAGPPGDLRRRHAGARSARRSAGARTSCSPTPTCSTSGSCPTTRAWARLLRQPRRRRGRRGARLPRRVRLPRRATCCAGCGAIAAAYGTTPRFLLASATIANPVELAERLTGLDDVRAGRRGRLAGRAAPDRDVEPAGASTRRCSCAAARWRGGRHRRRARARGRADDLLHQVAQGGRAGGAHRAREARRRPSSADRVAPYRAGYTPQQRRELEARLTSGELLAVITTDALELGIDIGALDAAVVRDLPGHRRLAAADVGARRPARARAGRLRRRRGRARPVLLPPPRRVPRAPGRGGDRLARERADPPRRTCSAPRTRARSTRGRRRDPRARAGRPTPRLLVSQGDARRAPRPASCCATPRTTRPRACRCARRRPTAFAVVDVSSGELLGTVEASRARSTRSTTAPSTCTSGAPTRSRELDLDARRALVEPFDGNWYTQPKRETDT